MKNATKLILGVLFSSTLLLSACQEGPAEKKGENIDNAVEQVKDSIQNKGPAQKAGEKVDEMTGN